MELARVETADGVWLDGLWEPASRPGLPFDACLLVHGTGANFYSPGVLEVFARHARTAGVSTLRINTRGHDGICTLRTRSGSRPGGAAFETVAEANLDLDAWLDWLVARAASRVVVAGHSMGGVKCLLWQAQRPHPSVRRLVAISPPRFHHATWQQHPAGAAFRADFARAAALVAAGEGESVFSSRQPLPLLTTAAGYVEKYGPADRYDFLPRLTQIACPSLVLVGELSERDSPAFDGTVTRLQHDAQLAGRVMARRIAGADIGYRNDPAAPWHAFVDWVKEDGPAGLSLPGREA